MLHIHNIRWKQILTDITCKLERGSFTLLIGPNASGKTSLLDIISGKKQPEAGSITLHDTDITHMPEHIRSQRISRLFQDPRENTASSLSVAENIAIARTRNRSVHLTSATHAHEQITQRLTEFNFPPEIAHTPMHRLSGGQRQLIGFIMATWTLPDILLLDEPTASLDTNHAQRLLEWSVYYQRHHHVALVIVTHDPEAISHLGNTIWWIRAGRLTQIPRNELASRNIDTRDLLGHIPYATIAKQ